MELYFIHIWSENIIFNNEVSPLHTAVNKERLEIVKYLVENGVDINAKYIYRDYILYIIPI